MADELLYASTKRKFDDQGGDAPPPTRRATGFSAPIASPPSETTTTGAPSTVTYNSATPPPDNLLIAKQRAQEIAARLFSNAEANRSKFENGDDSAVPADHSLKPLSQPIMSHVGITPPSSIPTYGYQGPSKKIEIPNGRVGVIIGRGGETIKYLQAQSGAKIQVARDMDSDPNSQTRLVELTGNSEQINKAEQLINDVLSEADVGGSGVLSARKVGNMPIGADQFVMKVPNNRVGLIIGKGGETIKSMQAKSGARIQIIPLHLPPGDTSQERTVQIDGMKDQIEAAKQLINEVTSSEARLRNPPTAGGYSQQGYHQPRPPTWGPPGAPQMQQPGYGYMQPGAYLAQPPQYNMSQPAYGGYPSSYPDQSSNQQTQQTATGTGYDYYGQQQQPVTGSAAPADNNSYVYNYSSQGSYTDPAYSQPTSGQQQGYGQDNYSGGYQAPPVYTQPPLTVQSGYDHQQGFGSAPPYPSQDGSTQLPPSQQVPPPVQASATQQGYNGQPPSSAAVCYPSQPGYGSNVPSLMPLPNQLPPTSQAGYIQPGYGQPPAAQSGYSQAPPPSGYGQQPSYGGAAAYSEPPAYDAASVSAAVPTGVTKASPQC